MDYDEKYKILERIEKNLANATDFTKEELDILEVFSKDSDEDIRSDVAKLLVNFTDKRGEGILLELAKDTDYLVCTEACDSLSQSSSYSTQKFLMKIVSEDNDKLLKGYAINSIGEISIKLNNSEEIIDYLEGILKDEEVVFIKINILKSLCLLGREVYINNLIELLDTENYQNRCAVLHSLEEVITDKNMELVYDALKRRRNIEKEYAVTSSIDNIMENMK